MLIWDKEEQSNQINNISRRKKKNEKAYWQKSGNCFSDFWLLSQYYCLTSTVLLCFHVDPMCARCSLHTQWLISQGMKKTTNYKNYEMSSPPWGSFVWMGSRRAQQWHLCPVSKWCSIQRSCTLPQFQRANSKKKKNIHHYSDQIHLHANGVV